jgi:uncharacterized membrane protein
METERLEVLISYVGHSIGLLGVGVIIVGIGYAGWMAARDVASHKLSGDQMYAHLRQRIGRGLVLGLEVLVAADIVETVAIEPNFTNIGVLGLIVTVRTFLGWSLEVELEGRWPWKQREKH